MALIVFDYDGVLADTLDDLLQFGQEACDQLGVKHRVTASDLNNLEVMSFATYGRACEVPEPLVDEFVKISLNLFAGKKSPPAIFEGVGEAVQRFAGDHAIAIVTTNTSQNVYAFLAEHDLDHLVHAVYGVDTPGSKAQKITLARTLLLKNGERLTFMVGDSLSDIRAAKEASALSIAVTWGHQSLENLLRGEPDFIARSPEQLIEIIAKNCP